jgi:hypothetical protein
MYVYVFNGVTYGQEIFSGYRIYGFSVLCAGFPGGTGTADSGISVGLGCVSCLWLCLEIRYPKTLAHYHHFPIEGRTSLYSEDIIGVNTNRDSRKEWLLMYVLFFLAAMRNCSQCHRWETPPLHWGFLIHDFWWQQLCLLAGRIQAGPMWTTPMIGVLF